MKHITLVLVAFFGITIFFTSCEKRVDCLCTASPVDNRNESLKVTQFYVTFKDGGDCDDASGPFYHLEVYEYNAVCTEIPQEQMNPDELNGGDGTEGE